MVIFRCRFIGRYVITYPRYTKGSETMAAKGKREEAILKCTECGEENYHTTRNKKTHPAKMELLKYCPHCQKKTLHKEKK